MTVKMSRSPIAAESAPPGWLLALLAALGANSAVLLLDRLSVTLGERRESVAWVAIAFGLAAAVATSATGAALQRYGTRSVLTCCASLVAAGTVAVAAAPSLEVLIGGRLAQGAGGAGMFALAMMLAATTRARGLIAAANGVLGAAGPLVGELLDSTLSWRVALGLSAVSLAAVPAVRRRAASPTAADRPASSFDGPGAAAVAVLITAVVLLPRAPVPAGLVLLLAIGAVALSVRRRRHGFVPLVVLRSRAFRASSMVVLALSTSYFALLYLFPRLIEISLGLSAPAVGIAQLISLLVGSLAAWRWTSWSRVVGRRGVVVPVAVGALTIAAAAINLPGVTLVVPAGAVFAATTGLAAMIAPAADSVSSRHRPTATGLVTISYLVGGAVGPSLASVLS